jgi:hypothetical protein
MSSAKTAGVILLLVGALGVAGYSFYTTFLVKPADTSTAEQREASWKAVAAFSAPKPGAAGEKDKKPAPPAAKP